MLTPWKKLSVEVLAVNPYWKYCKARYVPHHGKEIDYYFVDHGGVSAVLGVTDDGRIPMAYQYRPLSDRISLEFPMGGKAGKEALATAEEEFAEEAKMRAEHLEHVGRFYSSNGSMTEDVDVFVGHGLAQIEHGQDMNEEFEHVLLTPDEIEAKIADGTITDGMSIAAWHQAKPRVLAIIDQRKGKR